MRDKILAKLREKYKSLKLPEKFLEAMADSMAVTVTEESAIDAAVDGMSAIMASAAPAPTPAPAPAPQPQQQPQQQEQPKPEDQAPAWFKQYADKMETRMGNIEKGNSTASRKAQLEEKLKDLPEPMRKKFIKDFERMTFNTDEEFNGYLTDTEADIKELDQTITDTGLNGQAGKPLAPGGKQTDKSVVDDITSWAKANAPAPAAAAK